MGRSFYVSSYRLWRIAFNRIAHSISNRIRSATSGTFYLLNISVFTGKEKEAMESLEKVAVEKAH